MKKHLVCQARGLAIYPAAPGDSLECCKQVSEVFKKDSDTYRKKLTKDAWDIYGEMYRNEAGTWKIEKSAVVKPSSCAVHWSDFHVYFFSWLLFCWMWKGKERKQNLFKCFLLPSLLLFSELLKKWKQQSKTIWVSEVSGKKERCQKGYVYVYSLVKKWMNK